MNRHISRVVSAAAVGVLAGCGNAVAHGTASAGHATPTGNTIASPHSVLIVVAEPDASGSISVRLFHEDGTQAGVLSVTKDAQVVGASGSRIFFLAGGHLKALHANGSVEDLQAGLDANSMVLPSPDGKRWLWTTMASIYDGYQSSIYLGGPRLASRTIEKLTDSATWLSPVSWTPQGIFTQHMGGIDGYFVFGLPVISPVDRIDPDRASSSRVKASEGCSFADQAIGGTVACLGNGQHPTLRITTTAGRQTSIPLATPRFNYTGDAYFSPDGTLLTICGAVGVGPTMGNSNPQPEEFGADLVKVSDGSIVRVGPQGVRLAMRWRSWLPDGKLVLGRPSGAAGGTPGLFVLTPDSGKVTEIRTAGGAVGVLTSSS